MVGSSLDSSSTSTAASLSADHASGSGSRHRVAVALGISALIAIGLTVVIGMRFGAPSPSVPSATGKSAPAASLLVPASSQPAALVGVLSAPSLSSEGSLLPPPDAGTSRVLPTGPAASRPPQREPGKKRPSVSKGSNQDVDDGF
jgi:hypothetical protein